MSWKKIASSRKSNSGLSQDGRLPYHQNTSTAPVSPFNQSMPCLNKKLLKRKVLLINAIQIERDNPLYCNITVVNICKYSLPYYSKSYVIWNEMNKVLHYIRHTTFTLKCFRWNRAIICYVFTFTCNLLAQMHLDLFPLHLKLVHAFSV